MVFDVLETTSLRTRSCEHGSYDARKFLPKSSHVDFPTGYVTVIFHFVGSYLPIQSST